MHELRDNSSYLIIKLESTLRLLLLGEVNSSFQTILGDQHLQCVLTHEHDVTFFVTNPIFEKYLMHNENKILILRHNNDDS